MTENDLFVKELFHRLKHGEILHTISTAKAIGTTAEELRRCLDESVITTLMSIPEILAPSIPEIMACWIRRRNSEKQPQEKPLRSYPRRGESIGAHVEQAQYSNPAPGWPYLKRSRGIY